MTGDNGNTVNRKVREIFRALEFEKNYTKEEILEYYLNTIYLGQGCYGVQTAAEFYFGKDVSELDVAECACLIAITNNPSLYGPMSTITITREDGSTTTPREANKRRQEIILDRMAGGNEDVGITDLGLPDSGGGRGRQGGGAPVHGRQHLRGGHRVRGHRRRQHQLLVRGPGDGRCLPGSGRDVGHHQ